MGWSIKKPLGGKNSVARRAISKPIKTLVGAGTFGLTGGVLGAGLTDMAGNFQSKMNHYNQMEALAKQGDADAMAELERLGKDEEFKRQMLGQKQRGQINALADSIQTKAGDFRKSLAGSLADSSQAFFNRLNPHILEDLNSRGLFTSQTARDQEQTNALQEIAQKDNDTLRGFDTDIFNQINDLRGTALSAELGGDQSALDSALELRKASIQRRFDEADAAREQNFAEMLARRKSRDGLIASILGLGGHLGAGFLAGA